MLLDECIDLFKTLFIIANLNRMAMMTKMNASSLTHAISMDIEDPSAAQCYTIGGSLQILQTRVDLRGRGPATGKGFFVTSSNSVSLLEEVQ